MSTSIKEWSAIGIEDWPRVSREVLAAIPALPILLLRGNLGAGKTSLVQQLVKDLGYPYPISSPTFSLVNQYTIESDSGQFRHIFHIDLYRLESVEEVLDIGLEEYLDSPQSLCIIEWPDLAMPIIREALSIEITYTPQGANRDVRLDHFISG